MRLKYTTRRRFGGPNAVNWSHPLSRGLIDCIIVDGPQPPVNIGWPNNPVTVSTVPVLNNTPDGPGVYIDTGPTWVFPYHGVNYSTGNFGVRLRFIPRTGLTGPFHCVFNKGTADASDREMCFFMEGTTGTPTLEAFFINGNSAEPLGYGAFTYNVMHDFVATRTGTTVTFYQNGSLIGTQTNSATSSSSNPFRLGDGSGQTPGRCTIIAFQFWNRPLSPGEIIQLWTDPYCFLEPSIFRIISTAVVVPPPPTTLFAQACL